MNELNFCPQCGNPLPQSKTFRGCPVCLLAQGVGNDHEPTPTVNLGRFSPPTPEELNARFPQLQVFELIGQGGMGAVYRARQTVLDREVALKILPTEISASPSFAERFTREARALARLSHPHIVVIYEFGQQDELCYLLMEYVDGINLRAAIQQRTLRPAESLSIVTQICDALQYAHEEGIVHRDIKPENILLDRRGRVKIADFGLAKLLRQSGADVTLTGAHQVMGTLHYMAPEQLERPSEVDHRADIFSLGVVFYELLTGDLPLGRYKLPSETGEFDARLDDIVLRTLQRQPERRYQHASELSSDVQSISDASGPGRPSHQQVFAAALPPTSMATSKRRDPGPALLGGIMIMLGVALLLVGPRELFMLWCGLGLILGGAGTAAHVFSPKQEAERLLDSPNPGNLTMGVVLFAAGMVMWGLCLFQAFPSFGYWISIGLILGGASTMSKAWKPPAKGTLREWYDPDWSNLFVGGVMMVVGAVFVTWGIIEQHALFWVGFGLTIGGGGTVSHAWEDKPPKS